MYKMKETGVQNTHFTRDVENSSTLAETGVHAIFGKKVAGMRDNPEEQPV